MNRIQLGIMCPSALSRPGKKTLRGSWRLVPVRLWLATPFRVEKELGIDYACAMLLDAGGQAIYNGVFDALRVNEVSMDRGDRGEKGADKHTGLGLRSRRPMGCPIWTTFLALLGCVAAGCASEPGPGPWRVFVANKDDNSVSVIANERQMKVIPVGKEPIGLDINRKVPLLAVANGVSSTVTLIDPVKLEALGEVTVPAAPWDVAFNADGTLIYVACDSAKTVHVLDVARRQEAGEAIAFDGKPRRLVLSPDGRRLYVLVVSDAGVVAVVDVATRKVQATIPVGRFPSDLGVTGDGRQVVATSFDDDTMTVIDTASLQKIASHEVDTGVGVVVHPTMPRAYILLAQDDEFFGVDITTGQARERLPVGETPMYGAISPDGHFVYVANSDSSTVTKIDTEEYKSAATIRVGPNPYDVAVFPMPQDNNS